MLIMSINAVHSDSLVLLLRGVSSVTTFDGLTRVHFQSSLGAFKDLLFRAEALKAI